MDKFFETGTSWSATVARIFLGAVMLPHGLQKTVGLFGGHGFSGTLEFFTGGGMPWIVAFLVIVGESLGALGLIFGFLTRLSAFGVAAIMLGAIGMIHGEHGFFMNWIGQQAGEGFEYHLLALGLALSVMVSGAGRLSIDALISDRLFNSEKGN
ncbi:MAG: DoxX family protein [Candidatus Lindowbacteria bacterium]|nr:DoxX family protein [Candidatus Lindowbacteria bacterium]